MRKFLAFLFLLPVASAIAQDVRHDRTANGVSANEQITETWRIGDLSLSVRYDSAGHLQAGTMPEITHVRDADGRDYEIATPNGEAIAEFHFPPRGHVDSVFLANGMRFSVVKQAHHTYKVTLDQGRNRLSERVVSSEQRRRPYIVNLDPVASILGLDSNWENVTKMMVSDDLVTIATPEGKPLLYVAHVGSDRVGFDTNGAAVFYDIGAQVHGGGGDAETEVDEVTYLPDHVVLTKGGQIGAYVWSPAPNAISSFWSQAAADGKIVYGYRAGATAKVHPSTSPDTEKSQPANAVRRHLQPGPNLTCYQTLETQTQVCYDGGSGIEVCEPPVDTYTLTCYSDGSGSGTSTGGGSTTGLHVNISDSTLKNAVNTGIANGMTKLQSQQCAGILSMFTNSNGRTLAQEMALRGTSNSSDYLQNYLQYQDGTNRVDPYNNWITPCNYSNMAWVDPLYSPFVNVCTALENAYPRPGMYGNYLIHEMLHTLGMPEGGANMTSLQITNMINSACGQ